MGIDALDQPRIYLGMTELSRTASRSCFIYFSMRNFCQDVIEMMEWQPIQSMFTQIVCCRYCTLARSERASKCWPTVCGAYRPTMQRAYGLASHSNRVG